jgi:hypothetical protein
LEKEVIMLRLLSARRGLVALTMALALTPAPVRAESPSERIPAIIGAFMQWALDGREIPADPQQPAPVLPHRNCGGRLDDGRRPKIVYVAWQLSAEGQQTACNWKYDVAARRATPLEPDEAADVASRISAGSITADERVFFHSVPQRDGRLAVTGGYCWGSAGGTFEFRNGRPVLIGPLAVHGY